MSWLNTPPTLPDGVDSGVVLGYSSITRKVFTVQVKLFGDDYVYRGAGGDREWPDSWWWTSIELPIIPD